MNNLASFKCKSNILGKPIPNEILTVPLKYLFNFWQSLEMTLFNCKIHLELSWTKKCVMSNANENENKVGKNIEFECFLMPFFFLLF